MLFNNFDYVNITNALTVTRTGNCLFPSREVTYCSPGVYVLCRKIPPSLGGGGISADVIWRKNKKRGREKGKENLKEKGSKGREKGRKG
jgi:hypothetical protein